MSDYAQGELRYIGKRARFVESQFAKLPEQHRTREVFLVIAETAGIGEERALSHWAAVISLLPETSPAKRGRS